MRAAALSVVSLPASSGALPRPQVHQRSLSGSRSSLGTARRGFVPGPVQRAALVVKCTHAPERSSGAGDSPAPSATQAAVSAAAAAVAGVEGTNTDAPVNVVGVGHLSDPAVVDESTLELQTEWIKTSGVSATLSQDSASSNTPSSNSNNSRGNLANLLSGPSGSPAARSRNAAANSGPGRAGGAAGHSEAAGILVLIGALQVLRSFRDLTGTVVRLIPGKPNITSRAARAIADDEARASSASVVEQLSENAFLKSKVKILEEQIVNQRKELEKKLMKQLDEANVKAVLYQDEALHLSKKLSSSEVAVNRMKNTLLVMATEAETSKVAYSRIERELVRSREQAALLQGELNLSKEQQEELRRKRWEDVEVLQEYFARLFGRPASSGLRRTAGGGLEPEPFWVMRVQLVMRNIGGIGVAMFFGALFAVSALTYTVTSYFQPRRVVMKVLEGDTLYSLGARVGILDLEKQHPEIDPLCLKIDSTIDVEY